MSVGDIAAVVMSAAACIALIATWVRSGRKESEGIGSLKTELENIHKEVTESDHGLKAIKESVDNQKLYCANVSTEMKVRVEKAEKDINSIKDRKEKS